jgi:ring-1,2-phenylacetyl-CoA epoxidase subunit PaaA
MRVDDEQLQMRLAGGGMVAGPDDASDGYLTALTHLLVSVADSELFGMPNLFNAVKDAPSASAYLGGMAILQDEVAHALVAYRLLADLGIDTHHLLYERPGAECRHAYSFDIPQDCWAEFAVNSAFLDRAGFFLLGDAYHHTSYAPWKRALAKVHRDETFHVRMGERWMRLLGEEEKGRGQVQRAVDWMFLMGLEFGQPDTLKRNVGQLRYRLRSKSNDELRQDWLDDTAALCGRLGYSVPAHLDVETGRYVIDCPFPADFDEENKRWRLEDGPVGWDSVRARWRRRGPLIDWCLDEIRAGHHEVFGAGEGGGPANG